MRATAPFTVSSVHFAPATPREATTGLLGFVSCVLNDGLKLDGIALRRSAKADLYLAFPARRDRRGFNHPLIRPLNAATREAIEGPVLEALWAQGVLG